MDIRVGCFTTCAYIFMLDIVQGFNKEYPGITIEIIEQNNLRLCQCREYVRI